MWTGNLKSYPRSLSDAEILNISVLLINCNNYKPSDIHRSIRPLKTLKHWKGTEFRTVLLYVGIVVLKDYLSQNEYDLLLNLFCAVTICSTKAYKQYIPIARKILIDFNEMHINIYGEHSMTSNLHLLSHMVDDVEHLGDLTTMSAYPFENALHHIKMRLKQCDRPLAQIARRLSEVSVCKTNSPWNVNEKFPKLNHQISHENSTLTFSFIEYKKSVFLSSLNAKQRDRWFLTNENFIVHFDFAFKSEIGFMIQGCSLKKIESFFKKPFSSHHLNIFLSNGEKNSAETYDVKSIKAKLFCVPYQDKFVFIPLLHSL